MSRLSEQPDPIDQAARAVAASLTGYLAEEIAILLRRQAATGRLPGLRVAPADRTAAQRQRRRRSRVRDAAAGDVTAATLSFGA